MWSTFFLSFLCMLNQWLGLLLLEGEQSDESMFDFRGNILSFFTSSLHILSLKRVGDKILTNLTEESSLSITSSDCRVLVKYLMLSLKILSYHWLTTNERTNVVVVIEKKRREEKRRRWKKNSNQQLSFTSVWCFHMFVALESYFFWLVVRLVAHHHHQWHHQSPPALDSDADDTAGGVRESCVNKIE